MQRLHGQIPVNSNSENVLPIERRRDQRVFGARSDFKAVTIALEGGERLPGTVVNFSKGGAKIKVANPELVKGEFYLEIPGDDFIVKCRPIYIEDAAVGVQYIKSPRRLSWLKR